MASPALSRRFEVRTEPPEAPEATQESASMRFQVERDWGEWVTFLSVCSLHKVELSGWKGGGAMWLFSEEFYPFAPFHGAGTLTVQSSSVRMFQYVGGANQHRFFGRDSSSIGRFQLLLQSRWSLSPGDTLHVNSKYRILENSTEDIRAQKRIAERSLHWMTSELTNSQLST